MSDRAREEVISEIVGESHNHLPLRELVGVATQTRFTLSFAAPAS